MKTLIRKELRENFALAVLGLVVFVVLLAFGYRDYENTMRNLAMGGNGAHGQMQPLTEGGFQMATGFFCGLFGALLGWFQAYHERHRDLWSYLVHRPSTRSDIFLAKVIAGLVLYTITAGLPLAGFIAWALIPGNVAAPFEWRILGPILMFFLAGVASYFAGMLTCLRQARWYASRGLPLAVAFMLLVLGGMPLKLGVPLLLIGVGILLLGVASWGSFQTNGFYRGQRAAGGAALSAVLMFGSALPLMAVVALLQVFLPQSLLFSFSWTQYGMMKDGTVYKIVSSNRQPPAVADLQGHPLIDAKSGKSINFQDLGTHMAPNAHMLTGAQHRTPNPGDFGQLFSVYRVTPNVLWFYWPRYGRLIAYNISTRRPMGSLGPDGFTPDLTGHARFQSPPERQGPMLSTPTVLYRINLESRSVEPVFTADNDDPILDSGILSVGDQGEMYASVLTKKSVRLLTFEGQPVWKSTYPSERFGTAGVDVYLLEPRGQFALWITPTSGEGPQAEVSWYTGEQLVRAVELPREETRGFGFEEKIVGVTMPPICFVLGPVILQEPWPEGYKGAFRMAGYGLVVGILVCIPVAVWLGRRYSLTGRALVGWAVFLLLTGLPGLLAFLSVQEWPAREPCPKCGQKRVVEREFCEHCAAPFAPAEKLGIEIFEAEGREEMAVGGAGRRE